MTDDKLRKFLIWLGKQIMEIVVTVGIALLITQFVAQPIIVEGHSMAPTLNDRNFGISSRMFNTLERFDIVCIDIGTKKIIKRVIGLPGDNVVYKDNQLYVNDVAYDEPFINKETVHTEDFYVHVPEGEYFCLGDNREHSTDSRYYGTFTTGQIITKDVFLLYPMNGVIN